MSKIEHTFAENIYLTPTPKGAFYAVESPKPDQARSFLLQLMQESRSPRPITSQLINWTDTNSIKAMMDYLETLQHRGFIEGSTRALSMPDQGFNSLCKGLLARLSLSGKAMLVDDHGCTLAYAGFNPDQADMLAALSADLSALQDRHSKHLSHYFGLAEHGWGALDAQGNSRIAVWPLYLPTERLYLSVFGEPQFDVAEFRRLIWLLVRRYCG